VFVNFITSLNVRLAVKSLLDSVTVKDKQERKVMLEHIISRLYVWKVPDSNLRTDNGFILTEVLLGSFTQVSRQNFK
jgi:hypothetical protein